MDSAALPQDVMLLLCQELAARRDFATLFSCSQLSTRIASIALEQLYGIRDVQDSFPEGRLQTAQLWRSIILSSIGETAFPYCAFVRSLSLGHLEECLEDIRSDKETRDFFFQGSMQHFLVERERTGKAVKTRRAVMILDIMKTMVKCADSITKYIKELADKSGTAVALAHLEGYYIPHEYLTEWIPRLGTLTSLRLRDGSVLNVDIASAIAASCPRFSDLTCYHYLSGEADEDMAAFFQALRPNSLQKFEIISRNMIQAKTFTALNAHSQSLKTLILRSLSPAAMKSLNMLPSCTSLETLVIENDSHDQTLLTSDNPGIVTQVAAWISSCKSLRTLSFNHVQDALVILKDVLSAPGTQLTSLEVKDFSSAPQEVTNATWAALGQQHSLQDLTLAAQDGVIDGLIVARSSVLADSICRLRNLVSLNLMQAYVAGPEIRRFAQSLPQLDNLSFSGELVDDSILEPLSMFPNLKQLSINSTSAFRFEGLQKFAQRLQTPGHSGIRVDVLNQWYEVKLTEDEEKWLDSYFAEKLNGKIVITYPVDGDDLHEGDFSESD
ncbi:hypothetical protein F4780DRAFT_764058 [Xylariomycetidae sp. FL0641]|nr:hypothetical protein F4780DRAFT_764058 [Xylariomycetidae sp. FL0641]